MIEAHRMTIEAHQMTKEGTTMQTNEAPRGGAHERRAPWAERFAQRRRHMQEAVPVGTAQAEDWIPRAASALWALIDDAVEHANAALEQAGLAERIDTRRTNWERGTNGEYALSMAGPGGEQRHITVFVSLRGAAGRASGGAQVTTSQTRAIIYLVPSLDGGRLRWIVPRTGREWTAGVVHDLLLSVFGDDPAAATRLSPYFSLEGSV
jgi:hypothetical protein